MGSRKSAYKIDLQSLIISNCEEIIQARRYELLRNTNLGVVSLFWDIGSLVNVHALNSDKNAIKHASDELKLKYGALFSHANLPMMRKFAAICSRETLEHLAASMNWDYIQQLLKVKTQDELKFYANVIYRDRPSKTELQQLIASNYYREPDSSMLSTDKERRIVVNWFTKSRAVMLAPLLKPNNNISSSKDSSVESDLFDLIELEIIKFQHKYNNWLNLRFNLLFCDLGRRINELNVALGAPIGSYSSSLIKNLEHYGNLFNQTQIEKSLAFAGQFDDPLAAVKFAVSLPWSQLSILFELPDRESQIHYRTIAIDEHLGAEALRNLIESQQYQKQNTPEINDQSGPHVSIIKKESSGKRKVLDASITTMTGVFEPPLKTSVFENEDFMNFIRSANGAEV